LPSCLISGHFSGISIHEIKKDKIIDKPNEENKKRIP
jgi:hypothetical protein